MIWRVRLICCGRDDGEVWRDTWDEADEFRNAYVDSTHDRAGIIERIG